MADTAGAALMHLRNLFAVQRLNQLPDQHLVRRFVDEGDGAAFEVEIDWLGSFPFPERRSRGQLS
jgi:hypothetical protein